MLTRPDTVTAFRFALWALSWKYMTKQSKSNRRVLSNRLWKYRKRMDFTQRQVSQILGYVSPATISAYEHGRKLPSFLTALKLEIVYRVPVAFLFPEHYARLKTALREREDELRATWKDVIRRA